MTSLRDSDDRSKKKSTRLVRDIADALGKLPPQAVDLEEAVLGALMLESKSWDNLGPFLDMLTAEHFYIESNRIVFEAMTALRYDNKPVDMKTVVWQLREWGKLEIIGGAHYIAELTSKLSSSANIQTWVAPIIELSKKRDLIQLASRIHHDAYEDETDVFELIEQVKSGILTVEGRMHLRQVVSIKDGMYAMAQDIQSRDTNTFGVTGVPSGFLNLDKITHGWQKSDLIIIAARPGMGKTALMLSTVRNAAVSFGVKCGVISLEMATIQLVRRLSAMESELPLKKLRSEKFTDLDWSQLMNKTNKLSAAPIWIHDPASLTIAELQSVARQMKLDFDIELLVVDYMQLIKGDPSANNREQEISSISRGLKAIAKELNIPVIALSQLSRAVETRGGSKIPMLSDLRESGSIEQDADLVAFLWRPEYYKITHDDNGEFSEGITKLIVAKHRNGSLIDAFLQFIGKTTEFKDAQHVYLGQDPQPAVLPEGNLRPLHPPKPAVDLNDTPF